MAKTLTIIIQNAPYQNDNKAWHALRFAGAALASDMQVRVHLLDEGVKVGKTGQPVPEGTADLQKLLGELIECGLKVRACGMSLDGCGLPESQLVTGIERGSMKLLAEWINDSDTVLTF